MANITPLDGRTRVPTRIIFFDTETKDVRLDEYTNEMRLVLGYAIYTRWYGDRLKVVSDIRFRTDKEFWDFVIKIAETQKLVFIVAHNILFDMSVVNGWIELPQRGYELKSWYDKGLTSIYRWQYDKSKITLIDSTNFFQMKLANLGEKLGFEKLDIDFETATDAQLETYNIRDVEILHKAFDNLYKFWFTHDFGKLGTTIGSSAMAAFRKRFLNRTIITHRPETIRLHERLAYAGGRVFVGYQGKRNSETYYKLDYNSLYPSVMLDTNYPTKYVFSMYSPSISRVKIYLSQYCAIAYVELNTNINPFVFKTDDRNVYPTGQFSVFLSTPEILFAIENDLIVKVHFIHLYHAHNIFASYVEKLYDIRLQYKIEGNIAFEQMVKMFLNNLYGKFGQYNLRQIKTGHELPGVVDRKRYYDTKTRTYGIEYALAGSRWVNIEDGDGYHSFTAISAHVTANARLKWWEGFQDAGSSNLFYGDTDSYIVNQRGYNNLSNNNHATRLGALKLEDTAKEIEIFAPKDYTFGSRVARKGIPDNAIEIEQSTFKFEQFIRWKQSIIRFNDIKAYRVTTTKTLDRKIHDGIVSISGGWVVPLEVHLHPSHCFLPLHRQYYR